MNSKFFYLLNIILLLCTLRILAQPEYDKALKLIDKKDYEAALLIAKNYLDQGEFSLSNKILLNLKNTDYRDFRLYDYLGDSYQKLKVTELALMNYTAAEQIDSLNITLKLKIADLYSSDRRYTEAVNKYIEVTILDSLNLKALTGASRILYAANLFDRASAFLQKLINIDSQEIYFVMLVDSYDRLKKQNESYETAVKGLLQYPSNYQLIYSAAVNAFKTKRFAESLDLYTKVPSDSLTATDYVRMGRTAQVLKNDSLAVLYYESALGKDSAISEIYMDLGNLCYVQKNYDKAIKYYLKKCEADPNSEPAHRFLGFAYLQKQDWSNTAEALKIAVSINDTIVSSHFWLAQSLRNIDSVKAAIKEFEAVARLTEGKEKNYKNEALETYSYLGQVYFDSRNYQAALAWLNRAVLLKPESININLLIASAYHSSGVNDAAIRYYRLVLQLDPSNASAKKGLRMLSAD